MGPTNTLRVLGRLESRLTVLAGIAAVFFVTLGKIGRLKRLFLGVLGG
jgi:hypothetical protein